MKNLLEPGAAGLPSPSPQDEKANPLGPEPAPARPAVLKQFDSAEAEAAAQFKKLKGLEGQMKVSLAEFTKLAKLKDTVKMDDVVEAAGAVVAAGAPAVQVAGILAEVPQNSEALQGWVQMKLKEAQEQQVMLKQALAGAGYQLGLAAFQSLLADSAESWHSRKAEKARRLN